MKSPSRAEVFRGDSSSSLAFRQVLSMPPITRSARCFSFVATRPSGLLAEFVAVLFELFDNLADILGVLAVDDEQGVGCVDDGEVVDADESDKATGFGPDDAPL